MKWTTNFRLPKNQDSKKESLFSFFLFQVNIEKTKIKMLVWSLNKSAT